MFFLKEKELKCSELFGLEVETFQAMDQTNFVCDKIKGQMNYSFRMKNDTQMLIEYLA